ncbi:MAG: aminotransferase class V-fold PLP-dependent enzyme [Patescibacteria group bacterium]
MIKLIKSTFYKEEETKKELIKFIGKAEYLSFGEHCRKFEENFAKWQKRNYCVFVNSGSSANLALIQSLLNLGRIKKGDNIGFSSLTWSTNAMPLIQLGFNPIPVDVELDTLNVSSKKLLKILKKHTIKALFLTNLLGFCDDIDKIAEICKKKNIILIEDNCEALGTVYKGRKLGNFGLASTFSFYVGHHMSTVEGGAVCADDKELSDMLGLVRAHGWDRNLSFESQTKMRNKHKVNSTFYSRYTFYDLGYNLRPTEINGFIGNEQLKYISEIINKRKDNFFKMALPIYKEEDKYYPIKYDHIDFLSNFAVPIICKSKKIRDGLVEKCKDKIEIRPIVGGDMVLQPFFKKYVNGFTGDNINAKIIHEQGLYFGNNPEMTEKEIQEIIKIFTA